MRFTRLPLSFVLLLAACASAAAADVPGNLAPQAAVSVSSAHSDRYQAKNLVDGVIPAAMARDDIGRAWCAKGNSHPGGVSVTFEWPEPVTLSTLVYYGRTGWDWGENWKDYEVYLDGAAKPAARGQFKPGHGPQAVGIPGTATASKLSLKLLTHHGGPNPGASEIQVFANKPPEGALGKFLKPFGDVQSAPAIPVEESPQLAADFKAGKFGFDKLVVIERNLIRSTHVYTYHCEGQKDGGGLYVYDLVGGELTELVASPDGQILDCDVSHDARQILFCWRRGEYYQVYRINADGTGLVQLTDDSSHNFNACWLPDGDVLFLSTRRPQAAYCFFTPVGILFRMAADGSGQHRISSNYLNDFTPSVMHDGRIIYGRWEYVDRPAIPIQSLWTINPDGTALEGCFGNRVLGPATFIEPQSIPGRPEILCTMTGHNGYCSGAIGLVDIRRGDNAQEAIRNITPEIRHGAITQSTNGPRGPYQTPFPVDDTHYLVSHNGTVLLRDYEHTEQAVVLESRGMGFRNARPLRPRRTPPIRSSHLARGAGILPANDTPDGADTPTIPWATVYLQDVYKGLQPHVARGEVKQVAVVQELARTLITSPGIHKPAFGYQRVLVSCGATYVPKKVWGFARVADDGSAYFRVPAEVPIYFIALDAEGRAVQRMRSFTHLMPGEVQGCIGCHEPRTHSPHAELPTAALGEPQPLEKPEWGQQGFGYAQIVQPVLDQHCVECHNPHDRQGRIDLSGDRTDYFNVSYEVLARRNQGRTGSPFVSWIPTYNGEEWNILEITPKAWGSPVSKLAELILSGHPDEQGKPQIDMDQSSRRRVLMWIDLNVPYYPTADTAHPDLPACRQLLPADLERVMNDIFARRCAACHEQKKVDALLTWRPPKWSGGRGPWGGMGVRIENPELNDFLLAPLAKTAGGTGRCGQEVFTTKDDPDYQAVLKTFEPIHQRMQKIPRMDMPGAKPADCCPGTELTVQ